MTEILNDSGGRIRSGLPKGGYMHPHTKASTIDLLQRYANGEHVGHEIMRIVAANALEIISDLQREVEENLEIMELLAPKEGAEQ
ncbi:hypothetical protein D3C75_395850 [compost metagenome]